MSSATEQLCAGLDERGVEHVTVMLAGRPITYWGKSEADGRWPYHYWEIGDGQAMFMADPKQTLFTPEQAIAATLGPGTCTVKTIDKLGDLYGIKLSCGHSMLNPLDMPPIYCPWCGKKVVEVNE